jgi:excisionase family DNA binding protein
VNVLDEKLLTVGEVALRLRQSPRTVRDKIASGALPAIKIGAGPRAPLRIRAAELERWLDGAATGAARSPRRAPEEAA